MKHKKLILIVPQNNSKELFKRLIPTSVGKIMEIENTDLLFFFAMDKVTWNRWYHPSVFGTGLCDCEL